jgi:GDP-D-mannose dehydratase
MIRRGDASKAADKIDWQPKYKMDDVVRMMVQAAGEPDRQKGIKVPPPNAKR